MENEALMWAVVAELVAIALLALGLIIYDAGNSSADESTDSSSLVLKVMGVSSMAATCFLQVVIALLIWALSLR